MAIARRHVLRNIAATDYITDPEGRGLRYHYERPDRDYRNSASFAVFQLWFQQDDWRQQRRAYWEGIEARVRQNMADEILRRRFRDLRKFEEQLELYDEFLSPRRNKKGEILRDKKTGLPLMALELPRWDRFLLAYLKLHERTLLLRGEAIHRTEVLNEQLRELPPEVVRERGPKISREDARTMVRQLIAQQMTKNGAQHALHDGPALVQSGKAERDPQKGNGGGQ